MKLAHVEPLLRGSGASTVMPLDVSTPGKACLLNGGISIVA